MQKGTVEVTDDNGRKQTVSVQDFMRQHPEGFAGWKLKRNGQHMEAESTDSNQKLATSQDQSHTAIEAKVTTGPNAGGTLKVDGTDKGDHYQLQNASGQLVKDTTVNHHDDSHLLVDKDPKTGQHTTIDATNPDDMKLTVYRGDSEDPSDVLAFMSDDYSTLDGLSVDNWDGSAWYDDPISGSHYTIYDADETTYETSSSEAHTTATAGSSVASR